MNFIVCKLYVNKEQNKLVSLKKEKNNQTRYEGALS